MVGMFNQKRGIKVKKFIIYALILGSFGYVIAQGAKDTLSNHHAAIETAIEAQE